MFPNSFSHIFASYQRAARDFSLVRLQPAAAGSTPSTH